jgi:hypothetical protein
MVGGLGHFSIIEIIVKIIISRNELYILYQQKNKSILLIFSIFVIFLFVPFSKYIKYIKNIKNNI